MAITGNRVEAVDRFQKEPVGIVLASGRGLRFDPSGASSKLHSRLASGDAVLAAAVRPMCSVLSRVIVALRDGDQEAWALVTDLGGEPFFCAGSSRGQGFVLSRAILRSVDASGWVVALGDMPFVLPATIDTVAKQVLRYSIVAPVLAGKRGNPVGFGARHLRELSALDGCVAGKGLIDRHGFTGIEVNDVGVSIDIDTEADLDRWRDFQR